MCLPWIHYQTVIYDYQELSPEEFASFNLTRNLQIGDFWTLGGTADLPGKCPLFTYSWICAHYREQWIWPDMSAATKRPESPLCCKRPTSLTPWPQVIRAPKGDLSFPVLIMSLSCSKTSHADDNGRYRIIWRYRTVGKRTENIKTFKSLSMKSLRSGHTGPDNENENENDKNARPRLVE